MEGDIPSDGSPMKLESSKKRKRYGRMSESCPFNVDGLEMQKMPDKTMPPTNIE
ncbi:hypothetical protein J6590_083311 [Homalodisca vitripennis]|nr:hypothetical protein J6590_083311 [Homalodisca vitripennis]